MKYHKNQNIRSLKQQSRKRLLAVLFILVFVILYGLFVLYGRINRIDYNSDDATTSTQSLSTIASKDTQFTTPYFQFTAPKTWQYDQKSSTNTMYVYRDMRGTLLRQQLVIYVNAQPQHDLITYVVPVMVTGTTLSIGELSEHCGKLAGYHQLLSPVKINEVTINCAGDASNYNVAVGLKGGGPEFTLPRPNGITATYSVRYSNLEAIPNPAPLIDIIHSFQPK